MQDSADRPQAIIPELFDRVVRRHGERCAVVDDSGVSLSYAELDAMSAQVACSLIARGVRPGMVVAVELERSWRLIVSLVGIVRAGAAYLPLDGSAPLVRRQLMADGCDAILAITDVEGKLVVRNGTVHFEALLDPSGAPDGMGNTPSLGPDALIYVSYTSGSTGTPKGVMVPHRAVARLVIEPNYVHLSPSTVMLQHSSVTFDAATFEIWGALLNGGKLVLAPNGPATLYDIERLVDRHCVNTAFFTTALFNLLVDELPTAMRPLRFTLFGGERESPAHVAKALAHLPDTTLVHVYGPTECTTFATFHRLGAITDLFAPIPIGTPINATRVHVVDELLRPVPDGVIGEILISGDGVALGYVGNPQETAAKFLAGQDFEPGRVYRSGDFGYIDASGALVFSGRRDEQVKISGFRIELSEVAIALESHPAVRQAIVDVGSNSSGAPMLAAFVVAKPGFDCSRSELRRFLAQRLPRYMVPTLLEVVDALPINANGKIDRNALHRSCRPSDQSPARLFSETN